MRAKTGFWIVLFAAVGLSGSMSLANPDCQYRWSPVPGPDATIAGNIWTMTTYDDGTGLALYVGGNFTTLNGIEVNGVAKWDGNEWSALTGSKGTGTNGNVLSLAVFDDGNGPALYVGGSYTHAGGQLANRIAKWDGNDWSPLADGPFVGVDASVTSMITHDDGAGPALYVGGGFIYAGRRYAERIAKWDGNAWTPLSGPGGSGQNYRGVGGVVWCLSSFGTDEDNTLYIGGEFLSAGNQSARRIAKWDGTHLLPINDNGVNSFDDDVRSMCVFDDGNGEALYIGGAFSTVEGIEVNGIVKWNGNGWEQLPGPLEIGVHGNVRALAAFDDGTGSSLYAGGDLTTAGGIPVRRVAKWNGNEWSALGPGLSGSVLSMTTLDGSNGTALFTGGFSSTSCGRNLGPIAEWKCVEPGECRSDINLDGQVGLDDLNLVLANFAQTTYCGDLNADGVVNLSDLNIVLAEFGTPCP